MAVTEPILNIIVMDLHSPNLLGIADMSSYSANWNIVSPTLELSVPGYDKKFIPFTPKALQVLNSTTIGITCDDECVKELPDGVYQMRYSIYPAYKYFVDKTFLRVEKLYEKFDSYFLSLELDCKTASSTQRKQLEEVELYIQGAIAAANNCATKLALELYSKADKILNSLIKTS